MVQQFSLDNWYLLYSVQCSLSSDDSYAFNKACVVVEKLFNCTSMFPTIVTVDYSCSSGSSGSSNDEAPVGSESGSGSSEGNTSEGVVESGSETYSPTHSLKRERVHATLECLRTAQPLYSRAQWAKQPLDKLFASVVQRRLLLDADHTALLDSLYTKVALQRRKDVSGKPVQTVRSFNSTAHPLQTKRVGILR